MCGQWVVALDASGVASVKWYKRQANVSPVATLVV